MKGAPRAREVELRSLVTSYTHIACLNIQVKRLCAIEKAGGKKEEKGETKQVSNVAD